MTTKTKKIDLLKKEISNSKVEVEIIFEKDSKGTASALNVAKDYVKNDFIVIVGGLGPTFDDMTLEGIALALDSELEVNEPALKMVKEKYREYVKNGRMEKAELTSHRIKMAKLPKRADPLFNPVGTAPGVKIKHNDATLIALPGVPSEMKALFEESVLDKTTGHILNCNMIDYKWRTFLDLPEFQNVILETPIPSHRFKAIGVGEITTSPGPSAVLMAISNAIGKRFFEYPITPDKILKALGKI